MPTDNVSSIEDSERKQRVPGEPGPSPLPLVRIFWRRSLRPRHGLQLREAVVHTCLVCLQIETSCANRAPAVEHDRRPSRLWRDAEGDNSRPPAFLAVSAFKPRHPGNVAAAKEITTILAASHRRVPSQEPPFAPGRALVKGNWRLSMPEAKAPPRQHEDLVNLHVAHKRERDAWRPSVPLPAP